MVVVVLLLCILSTELGCPQGVTEIWISATPGVSGFPEMTPLGPKLIPARPVCLDLVRVFLSFL